MRGRTVAVIGVPMLLGFGYLSLVAIDRSRGPMVAREVAACKALRTVNAAQ